MMTTSFVSNPIKEIKVSDISHRQLTTFQETFCEYYGEIKDIFSEKNSLHVHVNKWHDSEAVYNFLKRLHNYGTAKIASNSENFWDVVPIISSNNEILDDFPAPKLSPNITNADLATKCWAPMKICRNTDYILDERKELFPSTIPYYEHERLMNEIKMENEKNIIEKNMWHNDCQQYEKLYYAALQKISELEKKIR